MKKLIATVLLIFCGFVIAEADEKPDYEVDQPTVTVVTPKYYSVKKAWVYTWPVSENSTTKYRVQITTTGSWNNAKTATNGTLNDNKLGTRAFIRMIGELMFETKDSE